MPGLTWLMFRILNRSMISCKKSSARCRNFSAFQVVTIFPFKIFSFWIRFPLSPVLGGAGWG